MIATFKIVHRNPQRSTRKLAKGLKISKNTISLLNRNDLKAFTKHRIHGTINFCKQKESKGFPYFDLARSRLFFKMRNYECQNASSLVML